MTRIEKKHVKAKKIYVCDFCLQTIEKGEKYFYYRGVDNQFFMVDRRHEQWLDR